jgi:hypothetical protein
MPARNRVTPLGEIEAFPLRGAWTGNRGILHRGKEIVRFHASDLWITCALRFRGRWREQWQPHHYTFLYFHDEAVSLAAGHRPCAECRRDSYDAYRAAWADGLGGCPAVGQADQPTAARRADRPRQPPPAHSPPALGRAAERHLRPPRRCARRGRRRPPQPLDPRGIPGPSGAAGGWNRERDHTAFDRRLPARRLPGAGRRRRLIARSDSERLRGHRARPTGKRAHSRFVRSAASAPGRRSNAGTA